MRIFFTYISNCFHIIKVPQRKSIVSFLRQELTSNADFYLSLLSVGIQVCTLHLAFVVNTYIAMKCILGVFYAWIGVRYVLSMNLMFIFCGIGT